MRDRQHHRELSHRPPTAISADGMESWYFQQKQRERELRQRRREAEAILRGYRGDVNSVHALGFGIKGNRRDSSASDSALNYDELSSPQTTRHSLGLNMLGTPMSLASGLSSEYLDDPQNYRGQHMSYYDDELGNAKPELPKRQSRGPLLVNIGMNTSDEEKKFDDDYQRSQVNQSIDSKRGLRALPDGDSVQIATDENDEREVTLWLDFISSEPGAKFPPERGRYHLYLSYACPGSHRVLIVRALKGLEDCISVTYVHPTWRLTRPQDPNDKHRGWVFGDPNGQPFPNTIGRGGPFPPAYEMNDPDPNFNAYSIREIYEQAADTSGKYTIPLLWDKKLNTIVNNESSDIAYMLNSCFNDFSEYAEVDLYTEYDEDGVAKLNEVSEWLAPLMIHGVYRCGFAKTQRAYNRAIAELCEAFDHADDILQDQRYLTGDTLTDADIRLFVSLLRFDEVYAVYFKANARLVMLTPNLLNFCRDVYQIPGVAETCNMEQIKAHFYGSHAEWNKYSVIPRGLGFMDLLGMPHGREALLEGISFSEC
jgi:glutathionyl-hydroquinone reductase